MGQGREMEMKRQRLTNNPRSWFNGDNALRIPGTGDRATGDSREDLYQTASGRWILHRWSIRHGSPSQWVEISPQAAAEWLERCGYLDEAAALRRKLKRKMGASR